MGSLHTIFLDTKGEYAFFIGDWSDKRPSGAGKKYLRMGLANIVFPVVYPITMLNGAILVEPIKK